VTWVSALAVFFIIWWMVLFATLPFGLKTQDEEGDVTLGTTSSAPRGPHVPRAMLRTTIVAVLIFGALWFVTRQLGWSFDDIPRIVPKFD
jgi:predicted secreted protein